MPRFVHGHERELITAAGALTALAVLALVLEDSAAVRRLDRTTRNLASSSTSRAVDRVLAPLFPVGLPGVYIPIAHAAAWWIGRSGQAANRIPATAWSAWLAHRAVKLVYKRERPRGRDRGGKRKPRRTDSYPSGHTTGITALSLALHSALREPRQHSTGKAGRRRQFLARAVLAAPVIMGAQRILSDDHWASDVLGGLALGSAVASICNTAAELISER